MHNNIHYTKFKRQREDRCNICEKQSILSWDHVPPKKSIVYSDVQITSLFNEYNNVPLHKPKFSQNGLKYRTICAECNNLIGTKYDIHFNNFIIHSAQLIHQLFGKSKNLRVPINKNYIVKSLFGHMLAAKADFEETTVDVRMRQYLLNNTMGSKNLKVFYWFYPYPQIEVVRDIAIGKLSLQGNNIGLFSLLKMYPIAFMITDSDLFNISEDLLDNQNDAGGINPEISLEIDKVYSPMWPNIVDDETIIMGGQSIASSAVVRPRIRK